MDQKNQNWAFDVVAIPQDNALQQPATTANTTPVKVKIRMKKGGKKGVLRRGVISIPKLNLTTGYTEKVRVVHSDQTIMSFDMLMESDVDSKTYHKQHNKFFHLFKSGKCLGYQHEDDNDPPYMLTTQDTSNKLKTKRLLLEENQTSKLSVINFDSKSTKPITKAPVFLGKCKRGGCLDPPFGEDKYKYQPSAQWKQDLKENEKYQDVNSEQHDLNNSEITVKKFISLTKIEYENTDIDSTLMLYKAESTKSSLLEKHSDSIITYPPETSSESLGISAKSMIRENSAVTNTSNNVTDTYFMPPKIMYQNNTLKKKDNNTIDQTNEVRRFRQSKDVAVPKTMKTKSLLQEKSNQIKGPPTHYESNEINKSDDSKCELRESINNVFDYLQQPNLKSLIVRKQKKSDVDITNNELIPKLLINSIDDTLVAENNIVHKYTENVTKPKTGPTFENEVDNILKHTISKNTMKSHSYNDLYTNFSPNDIVNTKGSTLEGRFNAQETINKNTISSTDTNSRNTEDSISNAINNCKTIGDSDVIQKLSDYVLPQSKLTESLTLDSVCNSTQSNSGLTSKENIFFKHFQNEFNEKQLSKADLQPLKNNVSKQQDNNEIVSITNLYDSKEKISIQPLDEYNKNSIQLHKSESIVSKEMKYVGDLNKREIIFNEHILHENINEYPTTVADDSNDDHVINNATTKVIQADTDVISMVTIKTDIISTYSKQLEIVNDENKSTSESGNSTVNTKYNNGTNENNIENLSNTERAKLEKPENKSIDNLLSAEINFSLKPEEKSESRGYLMYNNQFKSIESEIKLVEEIDGTTELMKSSFLKTSSTNLIPQNNRNKAAVILLTQVMDNGNIDNKVEENSVLNQEVNIEKGKFLQNSCDSPNNNVFPHNKETISSTENSYSNILETQSITTDHLVNDYKNNSISQSPEKRASSNSYDNHLFKENSGHDLFSKTQKLITPKSTINPEIPQEPHSLNRYNEKASSYFSIKAKDDLKTFISHETKQIPISLKEKKLSQDPFQSCEAKTVIVDLAFQMYRNDSNEIVLKTFDVSKEPKRLPHDSISVMKSILNLNDNNKMSLAINSEVQLCVEINKNDDNLYTEEMALNMRETPNDDLKRYSYVEYNKQGNVKNIQLLQKSLAAIYDSNLVPVEKLIKSLVAEIDNICKGGVVSKKKSVAPKKFKPLKSTYSQRCKCLKK